MSFLDTIESGAARGWNGLKFGLDGIGDLITGGHTALAEAVAEGVVSPEVASKIDDQAILHAALDETKTELFGFGPWWLWPLVALVAVGAGAVIVLKVLK